MVIERGRIVHRARSAEFARDPAMAERVLGLKSDLTYTAPTMKASTSSSTGANLR